MEDKSKKTILLREKVLWSLVEKFSEEMISKGVNLAELKQIATFLVVMNADNALEGDKEKKVLAYIEKVHQSMLDLYDIRYKGLKFLRHEKANTCIDS